MIITATQQKRQSKFSKTSWLQSYVEPTPVSHYICGAGYYLKWNTLSICFTHHKWLPQFQRTLTSRDNMTATPTHLPHSDIICKTWAAHTTTGYYVGNAGESYCCHNIYINNTRSNSILQAQVNHNAIVHTSRCTPQSCKQLNSFNHRSNATQQCDNGCCRPTTKDF